MRGNETPGQIVTNFSTDVGVHDVITSANFYDSHVRGFGVVGGQILGFSVDLHRRPYNTRTPVRVCDIITIRAIFVTKTKIKTKIIIICFTRNENYITLHV